MWAVGPWQYVSAGLGRIMQNASILCGIIFMISYKTNHLDAILTCEYYLTVLFCFFFFFFFFYLYRSTT